MAAPISMLDVTPTGRGRGFGRIIVGLSALFVVALAVAVVVVLIVLPSDLRNLILIFAAGIAAVAAFGYWTHRDKRFLLPEDKPSKDRQ